MNNPPVLIDPLYKNGHPLNRLSIFKVLTELAEQAQRDPRGMTRESLGLFFDLKRDLFVYDFLHTVSEKAKPIN